MSLVYLVRHAQASFGARDYDRLSELGRQQARWLGPCRPGMKPGEMVLPNGVTVNVMLGAAEAARTPPPAR